MSNSKTFYFKSGGAEYNLDTGFVCDRIEVKNLTQWETDTKEIQHYWNKSMANGYAYSEVCEDTSNNRKINTSNGFTPYNTNNVTPNQATITGATQASPCVLTVTGHGFGDVGDVITCRIREVVGMVELNGNLYKAVVIDANSVYLRNMEGNNLVSTGFTGYGSGGVLFGLSLRVEDEGFAGITIGTAVIGADDDFLEVICYQDDQYIDLGDIG